ncbi:tautomerase family protein [Rhodococcus ruber]|uniref:4-oxalocrotonate tautomerase-like domain-containing protein n=1 Tax=Rhodococcus ruber TaxID=1830 RepID=A0A098BVI1_9NOCA|nr:MULTISPECIES: tautomerase family protein [Rhodococcus]MDO2379358.1 tautomerase family protein [Rhodococcus ruber]RIK11310.1 MAG: 4-oxalocrotonate tautomerase [Acidobacteriota bacterium]ATQ31356.1 4-oxalocrotonate tautomerase [Rhodococcus ruber]AXY51188.1 4-oxalocrotonate tautomerase [Rhodococcus ruber]MBP2210610.1 phenylpyruvate tautomerase PptA (4-oxalocrotonate tautomerase family) [Rhodococcus ruber]
MPVAHFHLVDGAYTAGQRRRLLADASRCYAEVLDSPIERVRAFVVRYDPDDVATSGTVIADGGTPAPYFTAIVLAGRPIAQRQELAARFTDLIVEILGAPRESVRGRIVEADPVNWFIAGDPAAAARADEVAARAATTQRAR